MYSPEARALAESMHRSPLAASRAALVDHWSEPALRAAVRSGDVRRVLPEVFAGAEHAESLVTRIHAAEVWSAGRGVIVGAASAYVWGLLVEPPTTVRLTAPRGTNAPDCEWLTLVRTGVPIPASQRHLAHGANAHIADAPFAAVTTYSEWGPDRGADCVYAAARHQVASLPDLVAAMDAMPRLKGRRYLKLLLQSIAAGSESHLETIGLREVFNTAEFAQFVRQHRVKLEGRAFRLDMFDPVTRTAIELDGGTHSDPRRRERDIARDALLSTHGILTLRFSYGQMTRSPERCRQVVRRAIARRLDLLGIQSPQRA
ncbi:endonuclease domain-containing protein [Demequina sp. SO4-18]|uniref:endonuclease domain-containing protein n=1 Tax=Demequina sp. SO4-18 TaxID=3401026 RepID=UPI003B5C26CF